LSFIKAMKDKTRGETRRFVFHQGNEGQNSLRNQEICLSFRKLDRITLDIKEGIECLKRF
jgi:hypothetical protein